MGKEGEPTGYEPPHEHTSEDAIPIVLFEGEQHTNQAETELQKAHPFDPFARMDEFNSDFDAQRWESLGVKPTEAQQEMVYRVKLAYGILAYRFCADKDKPGDQSAYQETIIHKVSLDRKRHGNTKIVLTDDERATLAQIAKAAGIPYDPEKTEYSYDDIPRATWLDNPRQHPHLNRIVEADPNSE